MRFRRNNAVSDTIDFKFTAERSYGEAELTIGIDGYQADHDSTITNPNNMMFNVANFNDVEDDRYGLFIEWQQPINDWYLHFGTRLKQAKADAGDVSTSMAMMAGNMGMMAAGLRDGFNNADRSVDDTNVDAALSLQNRIECKTTHCILV